MPDNINAQKQHKHTNRLIDETSPYLLQHAHNPVDWYAWGEEPLEKAKREDKPILLSVGYSACHWCHVMERESFENEEIADLMNQHFVSIKVDREERPDIDNIYMQAVQAMTQSGGWPMTVFLTPDGRPFYGGTYFPPRDRRYGGQVMPGFPRVLISMADAYKNRRPDIEEQATELANYLKQHSSAPLRDKNITATGTLPLELLSNASRELAADFDPAHGGFGNAPKFPNTMALEFLLRVHQHRLRGEIGAKVTTPELEIVETSLQHMAGGGIYDQLGGGFHRYSVDAGWLVPHFEKMLYDNAQLLHLYLDAWLVSGETRYADVARDIIRYVLRDMTHPEGGFYSAEDADSEGKEGKFYCWTRDELSKLLKPDEFKVAVRYFGVTEMGNFVDHSDPNPLPDQNVLSIVESKLSDVEKVLLESAKKRMFEARSKRVRPHLDDKVLSSWNGMMLGALARAYAVLGDQTYRAAAEKNLAFIKAKLWVPSQRAAGILPTGAASGSVQNVNFRQDAGSTLGTLYHRWRDGERDNVQLLDAYAFLLAGVIDLYEATLDPKHLEFALALAETMIE